MAGSRPLVLAGLLVGLLATVTTLVAAEGDPLALQQPAGAQGANRAVVVVDDGVRRTQTCVTFSEPHLSGVEALQRARGSANVTLAQFGGMGSAVCSIDGTGCSVSGCLTCQAPKYWNYFRGDGGSPPARVGVGASATRVTDGDVEAWVWGASPGAPSGPSVASVCGLAPPATARPAPPATSAPGAAGDPAGTPSGGAAGPTPTTAAASPSAGQPGATGVDPATTATTTGDAGADDPSAGADGEGDAGVDPGGDGEDDAADRDRAGGEEGTGIDGAQVAASGPAEGGAAGWTSAVPIVLLLGVLGAWAVVVRRRRTAASSPGSPPGSTPAP